MHRYLILALGVFFVLPTRSLSPAPPPLEPVNWEADADSRFEPRVEKIVVDRAQHRAKQDDAIDAALWNGWGLEAMEPLRHILDEPRWEDSFKSRALDLMYACRLDGAEALLAEELGRRADAIIEGNPEQIQSYRSHVYAAATRSIDLLKPLLSHESPDVRYQAANAIILHHRRITEEVQPAIDAFAGAADPALRQRALGLLGAVPNRDNNARELEIAATISDDVVAHTKRTQESQAAQERATESMRLILDQEKN